MTRLFLLLLAAGLALPACTQSVTTPEPEGYQPNPTANDDDDDDDGGPIVMDDDDSTDEAGDDDDSTDEVGDDDDSTEPPQQGDDDDSTEPPQGSGICAPVASLSCGDEIAASTLDATATSEIDLYSCSSWTETGPEIAWSFTATESGPVTASLTSIESGQDLDMFVLEGSCDANNCLASGNTEATFEAVAGTTYQLVVDGYYGAAGSFTLSVTCGDLPIGDDDDDTVGDDDDSTEATTGDDDDSTEVGDDDDSTSEPVGTAGVCSPGFALNGPSFDSYENNGAGSTNAIDTYSCVGWDMSGPEYVYEYTATVDGQATAHVQELVDELIEIVFGPSENLDVFILDPAGGCNANSCVAYHDDTVSWAVTAGSTWYIVVDGYQGDSSPFDLTVTEVGNTLPPPPTTETECADGLDDDGDGLVDCDDTDCSANNACTPGTCIPARVVSCGDTDTWNNGGTGSWNLVDTYSCTGWNESGPEVTYLFQPSADAQVTVDLANMSGDLDVFVVSEAGSGCAGTNCAAFGNTSATFSAQAGDSWYVVVDGFNGAVSDFDLSVTCN